MSINITQLGIGVTLGYVPVSFPKLLTKSLDITHLICYGTRIMTRPKAEQVVDIVLTGLKVSNALKEEWLAIKEPMKSEIREGLIDITLEIANK